MSCGQTEIESAALARLALGGNVANAEYLTHFAVFLNDSLAVHQTKTVRRLNRRS